MWISREGHWLERKFNLSYSPEQHAYLLLDPITSGSLLNPIFHCYVLLRFLIWAASKEARNHVRTWGLSVFPEQFYRIKKVSVNHGLQVAHLYRVNPGRSDCDQLSS